MESDATNCHEVIEMVARGRDRHCQNDLKHITIGCTGSAGKGARLPVTHLFAR
jgi:hypothetical protein